MTDEITQSDYVVHESDADRRKSDPRIDSIATQVGLTDHRVANMERSMALMQTSLADLSKAMINIARVEERLAANYDQISRIDVRLGAIEANMATSFKSTEGVAASQALNLDQLTRMDVRVSSLEQDMKEHGRSAVGTQEKSRWLERFFIIFFTASLSVIGSIIVVGVKS